MGLKSILKVVGRLTGVLPRLDSGEPVAGRRTRLAAAVAALIGALLAWGGIPEPVAQAAAGVFTVLAAP